MPNAIFRGSCFLWLGFVLACGPLAAMELHRERAGPTDLEVTGLIEGVAAGESRFVRWTQLAALPQSKLTLTGEFLPGPQEVTVVYLSDLWAALPRTSGADVLLASCTDGYASVYRARFIADYRPFLILEVNGRGPEHWPPPGLKFNPGPYVISVAAEVVPAVANLLDVGHKKPWGVAKVRVARYAEAFGGVLEGEFTALSPRAIAGREIWVNSCASCHAGGPRVFGGTKSDRTLAVLAAHARHNREYFKNYVRDPKGFLPTAKMEPHPHYTDEQLEALIAFLVAERDQGTDGRK